MILCTISQVKIYLLALTPHALTLHMHTLTALAQCSGWPTPPSSLTLGPGQMASYKAMVRCPTLMVVSIQDGGWGRGGGVMADWS